jgi:lipoprotein-anchoring transpeptidase ErfK/SrfK
VPGTPTLTVDGNTFSMSMGALPQGKSTVKVFVRDPAGNTSSVTSQVMVDSTEDFGSKDLMPGAVGKDVKTLQEQLKARGFKKIALTGVYDKRTEAAVARYQKRYKLRQSGLFLVNTREKFVGRIVIDLSDLKLRLFRDGKAVMTFPVAVGMPAFPTPTGNYYVVNKQSDPTWTPPPDSSWAKGLGPIPPGPGNPLGTRWIGTSAPLVGIHGTNAPSSIGTRASHGCIRMRIPDVEKLYDQVAVGMPVQMRS